MGSGNRSEEETQGEYEITNRESRTAGERANLNSDERSLTEENQERRWMRSGIVELGQIQEARESRG